MTTRVVKFQDVRDHWNPKAQRWDSDEFVYIGRFNKFYNVPASKWGNYPNQGVPFYKDWIRRQPQFRDLEELRGKILVCWCKGVDKLDTPCHGDALVELLGETLPTNQLQPRLF